MSHAFLDTIRVIGNLTVGDAPYEVCAEAIANHDRLSNEVTVNLSAFLRAPQHGRDVEVPAAGWLPAPQVVTEHVDLDEAHEMVKEIFSVWCHKVAEAMPR